MKVKLFFFSFALLFLNNSFAEQIKVGVSVPLTGVGAEYGNAAKNGFILAQEKNSELKRFVYILEDNFYLPGKSLDSYHKLKTIDGVQILYVWGEPGFNSIAPIAEAEKFPFFCMSIDRSPGVGKKYAVRVSGDTYQLAGKLVEFLKQKNADSIQLIMAEDPFFEANRQALTDSLGSGIKLSTVGALPVDNMDFRSLILKLRNSKPKFVGVFLMAGQVRSFFTQAAILGLSSQFVGTDVFESREEIRESGKLINGSVYANFYVPESFNQTYTKRFGNDSQISHAYMAYAFALSLPLIAPENTKLDAETILQNLKQLDWKSTGGVFTYKESATEGPHFEFPVVLREIKDGSVHDLDSLK